MASSFLTGTPGQGTGQPDAPALPAIPDLDGTAAGLNSTVQALADTVRILSGQNPSPNNLQGLKVKSNKSNKKKDPNNSARFVEKSRQTKSVTVSDPVSGASVTFNQITQLVMQDTITQELWTWNL